VRFLGGFRGVQSRVIKGAWAETPGVAVTRDGSTLLLSEGGRDGVAPHGIHVVCVANGARLGFVGSFGSDPLHGTVKCLIYGQTVITDVRLPNSCLFLDLGCSVNKALDGTSKRKPKPQRKKTGNENRRAHTQTSFEMGQHASTLNGGGAPSASATTPPAAPVAVAAHFALLRAIVATQPRDTNVFVSPAALHAALCAAAFAATPDRATARQLLGLLSRGEDAATATLPDAVAAVRACAALADAAGVKCAQALVLTSAAVVKPAFCEALQSLLNAQLIRADSAVHVNEWVARQTGGAVDSVLEPGAVTPATAFLLVNAVLFRDAWEFPFDSEDTRDGVWAAAAAAAAGRADPLRVPYMRRYFGTPLERLHAGVVGAGAATARAVCVPYTKPGTEAWFLLPVADTSEALDAVGDALPELWREVAALQHAKPRIVHLTCPRFRVDTGAIDIVPALKALGVDAPFEPQGGFREAVDADDVCIRAVLQRVTCAVNEAGTVAAAATVVEMMEGCCPSKTDLEPFNVKLDRPFWMAIVARQLENPDLPAVPFFIGRVVQPSAL
jgi:serine protease inhibitor